MKGRNTKPERTNFQSQDNAQKQQGGKGTSLKSKLKPRSSTSHQSSEAKLVKESGGNFEREPSLEAGSSMTRTYLKMDEV